VKLASNEDEALTIPKWISTTTAAMQYETTTAYEGRDEGESRQGKLSREQQRWQ
jgi:hypothetical protein